MDLNAWVSFWAKHYAKPMGEIAAQLLYRYGLLQLNPHEQQFLIQLDKETLEPTGKIVLRDLGDTFFANEIYEYLGLASYGAQEEQAYTTFVHCSLRYPPVKARVHGAIGSFFIGTIDHLIIEIGQKFWKSYITSYLTELQKGVPGIEDYFPEKLRTDLDGFKLSDYESIPVDPAEIAQSYAIFNFEEIIADIIHHPSVKELWEKRKYHNLAEAKDQITVLNSNSTH